jgi:hypothetical protein
MAASQLTIKGAGKAYLGLVQVISVGERESDFDTPIIPHRLGKGDHLSSALMYASRGNNLPPSYQDW